MFTPTRRGRAMSAIVVAALTAVTLCGCTSSAKSSTTQQASDVKMAKVVVTGAHINTPVVSDMTGAFATVTNNSSGPVRLISVSVPSAAAQSASLHTMAMVDGKMAMTPVKGGIVIPARSTLQLKSGGFHMMLMMPMLKSGEVVPITFAFSNGLKVTAAATVAKPVSSPTPSMSSSM